MGPHDPLASWEDHEACWRMQYRGSLGKKNKTTKALSKQEEPKRC